MPMKSLFLFALLGYLRACFCRMASFGEDAASTTIKNDVSTARDRPDNILSSEHRLLKDINSKISVIEVEEMKQRHLPDEAYLQDWQSNLINDISEKIATLEVYDVKFVQADTLDWAAEVRKKNTEIFELTIIDEESLPNGKWGLCQGDCDKDKDCEDGLECFQRSDDETVPGCVGDGESGKDYCYIPQTLPPTAAPTEAPTPWRKPLRFVNRTEFSDDSNNTNLPALTSIDSDTRRSRSDGKYGLCEGDCDDDSDCQEGLRCFERSSSSKKTVPGCYGEGEKGDDYCYDPKVVAYLGACEGPCNDNDDCIGGLECYNTLGEDFVPGCAGVPADGKDYCIDPSTPGPNSVKDEFRLRLHWDHKIGDHDGKWCMDCSSSCDIGSCGSSSDKFEFLNLSNETTMIKKEGSSRCLEQGSDRAVSYDDRTLGHKIKLSTCDESNPCQWFTSGVGSFGGFLFELRTCTGKCVSQDHYPRSGEDLFGATCSTAARHYTNYWFKY